MHHGINCYNLFSGGTYMINIINKENYKEYNIGNKAENLFKMQENNMKVPELVCIQGNDIEKEEDINSEIIDRILSYFPQDDVTFAVRSSSNMEDGKKISFAGQFDTYLNVRKDKVREAILKCINSVKNTNVKEYCSYNHIEYENLQMNVIIEEMINPDVSGILFSANPQGILNESVIVVGEGLGENVVNDLVPTTSYYYNLTDDLYYYESQENAKLIDDEMVNKLIELSAELKKTFGDYIDMEFGIINKDIYILQVRNITTLNTDNPLILDNSNIVESYPGISLPLTASFVQLAYSGVFKGLAKRCIKNDKLLESYDEVLKNMVGSVNGRVYYQISNWYTVIKFLPFSKKIVPVWQEMLGVKQKNYEEDKNPLTFWQRVSIYKNSLWEAFHVQSGMKKLNRDFFKVQKHFETIYNEELSNKELITLFEDIKVRVLENWDITLLNDMYSFLFTGLLKNSLKRKDITDYEKKTNDYISGIINIESLKPVCTLMELTAKAIELGIIKDIKAIKSDEEVIDYLQNLKKESGNSNHSKKASTDFIISFWDYIQKYGDRALEELKLESRTYRSNPILLMEQIVEYGKDIEKFNSMRKSLTKEKTTKEMQKRSFFGKKAMAGIQNREISRMNRSRIYGMIRTIFLTFGSNFVKEGILQEKKDIFYLTIDEIFSISKTGQGDMLSLINKRKADYLCYKELPDYSRIIFEKDILQKKGICPLYSETDRKEIEAFGIPCSSGYVIGEAVVVKRPEDVKNIKDKILITKMTDPGWVFLLNEAKGLISEMGSLLSHTAIISRELGIPAVVGVSKITQIIKTGDIISLDGSTGKIEILKVKEQ